MSPGRCQQHVSWHEPVVDQNVSVEGNCGWQADYTLVAPLCLDILLRHFVTVSFAMELRRGWFEIWRIRYLCRLGQLSPLVRGMVK